MSVTAFELGRVIWEARIRAAWHPASAELRLTESPWPPHATHGSEPVASHDLAIAEAKAILKHYEVVPRG